jgi:thiol-disulfide isomerase/thioredoxin
VQDDAMTDKKPRTPQGGMLRPLILAAVLGAVAGLVGIYGIGGLKRNGTGAESDPACAEAVNTARRIAPFVHGEVAALVLAETPRRVPELGFRDASGKLVQLSDFRGRTVLINLWATWCVPCRKEMPALDRLARQMKGEDFTVVAINLDARDPEKPRKFLSDIGVQNLAYYEDSSNGVFNELKRVGRAMGLPTSILVDRKGCEIGYLAGPAEWSSEDAVKLVKAAFAK